MAKVLVDPGRHVRPNPDVEVVKGLGRRSGLLPAPVGAPPAHGHDRVLRGADPVIGNHRMTARRELVPAVEDVLRGDGRLRPFGNRRLHVGREVVVLRLAELVACGGPGPTIALRRSDGIPRPLGKGDTHPDRRPGGDRGESVVRQEGRRGYRIPPRRGEDQHLVLHRPLRR